MRTPESWPTVFMSMAAALSRRSKDPSTQVGAVLVSEEHRILGAGFNGPPPQVHDDAVPWDQRPDRYAFIIHAEENAILDALDKNPSERLEGSTLYVTAYPCPGCVLRAIRAGVVRIVYGGVQAKCVDQAAQDQISEILASLKPLPSARFRLTPYSEVAS